MYIKTRGAALYIGICDDEASADVKERGNSESVKRLDISLSDGKDFAKNDT